jgi:hypothetical protein
LSVPGRRRIGAVEREYRAYVATLGLLSARQKAQVAQIYALAEQLDAARGQDQPLSAVATLSRELRVAAADLRDVATVTPPAAVPVADSVDQVAAKRAARRAKLAR